MALYNITTTKEFQEKVLHSTKVVLVDFWADWCPPCRAMAPALHDIAEELDSVIDVVKVDVNDRPENQENMMLAMHYGVQSIPNMPIFVNGKEVDRIIGLTPKAQLVEMLMRFANAD